MRRKIICIALIMATARLAVAGLVMTGILASVRSLFVTYV